MTHVRFGRSHFHPTGQLTHTRLSDGDPDPDGSLTESVRIKICHCRNVYLNRPNRIAFLPLAVDTSGCLYDDFICLFFLHDHREVSVLTNELSEESDQFRFTSRESKEDIFKYGMNPSSRTKQCVGTSICENNRHRSGCK